MSPGDQLICAFITPLEVGRTFRQWPLHATIVPWLEVRVPQEKFERLLKQQLQKLAPFKSIVRGQTRFGFRTVNLLLKSQWKSLHAHVLTVVRRSTRNKTPFRFVGKLYTPHVTHQGNAHLNEGDVFWCDALYIVEQKGTHKAVIAKFKLEADNET